MNYPRIAREFVMHVSASPDRVFPLLCPVREYEWIETWKCEMVHSKSGFAELDCVFKTRHGDTEDVWTVSRYEPNERIEFVVNSVFRVMRYGFTLSQEGERATKIVIEQTATALNREGGRHAEDPQFEIHMKTLEIMLNHYLLTGKMITDSEAIEKATRTS
jgi:hypothetical protein